MSLRFHSPGTPLATSPSSFENGLTKVKELGLDGEEVQFGRGIFLKEPKFDHVRKQVDNLEISLTIHAPYYVNLNAKEPEKITASINRILATARIASEIGARSICFHPGFRFENSREEITNKMREALDIIEKTLIDEEIAVDVRPETAGKKAQFGLLEEVIDLCNGYTHIKPCIDFAHLMATSDGEMNSYDSFCNTLEILKASLGDETLTEMHIHAGTVAFSDKGEIKALNLDDPESVFKYQALMKALKEYNVSGWIVAETPDREKGALLLKEAYEAA